MGLSALGFDGYRYECVSFRIGGCYGCGFKLSVCMLVTVALICRRYGFRFAFVV